jgi:CPA2 family monovalent cation:H+ antiporter-2
VSFALGAFFAGMMMRESELSHRAAEQSLPLRDAFAVLFFVSVGMLFDPRILVDDPGKLVATAAIVIVGTPLVAMALVLAFRYPLNSALMIGASLSQIGEFSFILAALGTALGVLPPEGQSLVVAAAIVSIALNPLVFSALRPLHTWLTKRSRLARRLETSDDPLAALPMSTAERFLSGQVVLVGYGRVGRLIAGALDRHEVPYVVAEQNRERVEELRRRSIAAVSGDGSQPSVLIQAHIAKASMLVIATPDMVAVRRMAEIARTLNPGIEIVVRTHDEEEAALLAQEPLATVFYGEKELALTMTRHVLGRRGIDAG